MQQAFDNLCGAGKPLKAEAPDANEIEGLLRTGRARLLDSRNTDLALESCFDPAYDAAHTYARPFLRCQGYRSSNWHIVFQVLPHTLGLVPEVWRVLDKCHNIRDLGEYEGMLDVDEGLAADLIAASQKVSDTLAG